MGNPAGNAFASHGRSRSLPLPWGSTQPCTGTKPQLGLSVLSPSQHSHGPLQQPLQSPEWGRGSAQLPAQHCQALSPTKRIPSTSLQLLI